MKKENNNNNNNNKYLWLNQFISEQDGHIYRCGISHTIFTCLPLDVWSIPHSIECFYEFFTKIVLVKACTLMYPYEMHFNSLQTFGCYILSVRLMTKYSKKYLKVLIIFYVCTFCVIYTYILCQLIFLKLTFKCPVVIEYNQASS